MGRGEPGRFAKSVSEVSFFDSFTESAPSPSAPLLFLVPRLGVEEQGPAADHFQAHAFTPTFSAASRFESCEDDLHSEAGGLKRAPCFGRVLTGEALYSQGPGRY